MVVEMTKSFYQDRRDLNKLENQVKKKSVEMEKIKCQE